MNFGMDLIYFKLAHAQFPAFPCFATKKVNGWGWWKRQCAKIANKSINPVFEPHK